MRIIGIDPGVRNLGLAYLDDSSGPRYGTVLYEVNGPDEALERICAYIGSPVIPTILAVEGWGNYGPRKGAFAMLKVIGGVHGIGAARGYRVLEFMPREKERVGKRLSRPVGMTDHEWDALCIAHLAKEQLCQKFQAPNLKSLSSTSSARGSRGISRRSSPLVVSGSGKRKRTP